MIIRTSIDGRRTAAMTLLAGSVRMYEDMFEPLPEGSWVEKKKYSLIETTHDVS